MGRSEGRSATPGTLAGFLEWLSVAPSGVMLSAEQTYQQLRAIADAEEPAAIPPTLPQEATWREKLWTVPTDTRMTVPDVAEAIGRPLSWVYRHTSVKSAGEQRLPHRKMDGELLFVAGEIRAWLLDHEETVHGGRSDRSTLRIA
jgi:hypothetical protein